MRRPGSLLAFDRGRTRLKSHLEPALWQIHDQRIIGTFGAIIFRQLLPQPGDVHSYHEFVAWIIRGRLGEYIQTDGVFFKAVARSRKRFFGEVNEKITVYFRSAERLALNDALDLCVARFQLKDHLSSDDTTDASIGRTVKTGPKTLPPAMRGCESAFGR